MPPIAPSTDTRSSPTTCVNGTPVKSDVTSSLRYADGSLSSYSSRSALVRVVSVPPGRRPARHRRTENPERQGSPPAWWRGGRSSCRCVAWRSRAEVPPRFPRPGSRSSWTATPLRTRGAPSPRAGSPRRPVIATSVPSSRAGITASVPMSALGETSSSECSENGLPPSHATMLRRDTCSSTSSPVIAATFRTEPVDTSAGTGFAPPALATFRFPHLTSWKRTRARSS